MAQQHEDVVRELLKSTTVSSIPTPKGEIVSILSSQSPYEGFQILVDKHILSAPVFDEKQGKYSGFLDIKDLASFVVFVDDDQKSDVPQNLHELIMHGCKLFKVPLDGVTCTYLSRRNPFHSVGLNDSLLSACEVLSTGVHRVPVVDDKGKVVNIISQSSIIGFLNQNANKIKQVTQLTVGESGIGSKPVICVSESTPAIETFRLMDNKKISSVAVVNAQGQFTGNTSASDLKLFMRTLSLEILAKPVNEFLKEIRQESIEEKNPTMACSSKDTLQNVIGKLASTKIHKLFVANDADGFRPVAVVSITDILRHLLGQSTKK